MSELFTAKTMPEEDWSQVPKPNGWDYVVCERIVADNNLGVYVADARQGDTNGKTNDYLAPVVLMARWQ